MPVDNRVQPADGIFDGVAGTLAPEVAIKYSISTGSIVYEFTVRPDVTFSNGNPVNAETLRYSYLRALEGPGYASELMQLLTVSNASQLVVTGPMAFEIHLSQPNPLGPKLLPLSVLVVMDPVLSRKQATRNDPWATSYYRTHMMGTGPYVQGTTWQSGNQYLLSPNPRYWNTGHVRNSGVLLKYLPSADDRALLVYEADPARRELLSRMVQQRFAADVPYVPRYSENFTLAARTNISGINVFPDHYVRFWMLSKS